MPNVLQNIPQVAPTYVRGIVDALLKPLQREKGVQLNSEIEPTLVSLLGEWNSTEESGGLCVEWESTPENKKRVQALLDTGLACESSGFKPEGYPRHFPVAAPFVVDQTEPEKIRVYPHRTFIQEAFLAYHIANLVKNPLASPATENLASPSTNSKDFQLSKDQEEAIRNSSSRKFSIISGGPGTGKTTSVVRILEALLANNPKALIYLTAPTGKAKSRIVKSIMDSLKRHEDSLKHTLECINDNRLLANTIHMWLATPTANGKRPSHKNPLECDVLVIDEASMMDSEIASKLFDAIDPETTSVIVLGDMHQLAAVGPGSVYADISDPNGALKDYLSVLKTNHRFNADQGIGKLSTAINEDVPGESNDKKLERIEKILYGSDLFDEEVEFIEAPLNPSTGLCKPAERCINEHIQNYARKIKEYLIDKESPTDEDLKDLWDEFTSFRALAAQRRGPMSVEAINNFCIERLKHIFGIPVSEKDFPGKVLIVRHNDRSLNVANGDDGFIYQASKDEGWTFYAGATEVKVPLNLLTDYDVAFAITIHQSQGSGYKEVAVFLPEAKEEGSGGLATRELLYTAITRAEEKCIIFGSEVSLQKCIQTKTKRTGGLSTRLREFVDQ